MKRNWNLPRLFRTLITLFGAAIGAGIAILGIRFYLTFIQNAAPLSGKTMILICSLAGVLFALIAWILAPNLMRRIEGWTSNVETLLRDKPLTQIVTGTLGLIVGLIIATLITQLFRSAQSELLFLGIAAVLYTVLGYLGLKIGARRWREMPGLFSGRQTRAERRAASMQGGASSVGKILDTSVIIDGRILDVCKTGFVEGPLVIPQFVLAELRHIADSSDPLRRTRGRRGLDILQAMQSELDIEVQVTEADFEDVAEVDVKLLKLAQQIGGVVMTNDFNLNKVASVTGVKVLNLNDLAGALRPVLLPGEEMTVQILREGKEHGQGVGYLDDGTMIVVDNGKRYIGQTIEVVVTTVLQTSAGRMIFTKVKGSD